MAHCSRLNDMVMNHSMDVNTRLPNESLTFLNAKLKEK
jgi:hypothetical protein